MCTLFALSLAVGLTRPAAGDGNNWTLSTSDTRLTIGVQSDRPVVEQLAFAGAKHNWAAKPMPVPLMASVWVGGREIPTQWKFEQGAADNASATLVLTFSNAKPKLALHSVWRARPGRGPVEHWIEIENLSAQRVTVSHQDSLTLSSLRCGAKAQVWWINRGGNNAVAQGGVFTAPVEAGLDTVITSIPETGTAPVPWMAVQVGKRRGLYVGWEFSGVGRVRAKAGDKPNTLSLHVGNVPGFKTDIEAGETFLVPPAFVGCYTGDIDEGGYQLHRFVLEKLRPPLPKDCPDPLLIYNCFFAVDGSSCIGTTQAGVMPVVKAAAELGFETFVFDAIWYREVGDWRWDPKRFPNGMKPFQDYLRKNGLRVGYWCAWTNMGISEHDGALSARGPHAHPDWLRADVPDDAKPGQFWGVQQVCLGSPNAKEWAIKKTQELVRRDDLDFLKHDIFMVTNSCNKTTHRHAYGSDVSYWAATGYYEVQDALLETFPSLLLENCSAGGCVKDFGVIQRSHYTVTTDTLANLANRMSIYDSTYAFPPVVLLAYTVENWTPDPGDKPGPFLWRSAMLGTWVLDPKHLGAWTEEQRLSVKRATAIYRQWLRPVIQDCVVHHVLPRPDGKNWDGMFYWNPGLKRGTLYVFRPDAPENRKTVKLKGLDARKKYWLWCEDGSIRPGIRTGKDLMTVGLDILLPGAYTSDLIFVQDEVLGKPKGLLELDDSKPPALRAEGENSAVPDH